ncbi:hypothetical protein DICPUDRAFT_99910 [Dictyostelium purpureum]|uniref:UBR-type domain-containing protein n=1 Tax=Dictyostelium purpureum TaxID=5786 RepID=F1A3P5_DICPU|nr:uncharacterized protein DICPUDRAFT_99910 [Dictyostelium purpureum]EGC29181.1 hypothetical protein DICPUDRAFT_99910 [Dictyostelium purpureum]|eukprot:XP_003294289.1 hypothetical protein DICPUDRAFT_99910 [Dictyostelium purpureum]
MWNRLFNNKKIKFDQQELPNSYLLKDDDRDSDIESIEENFKDYHHQQHQNQQQQQQVEEEEEEEEEEEDQLFQDINNINIDLNNICNIKKRKKSISSRNNHHQQQQKYNKMKMGYFTAEETQEMIGNSNNNNSSNNNNNNNNLTSSSNDGDSTLDKTLDYKTATENLIDAMQLSNLTSGASSSASSHNSPGCSGISTSCGSNSTGGSSLQLINNSNGLSDEHWILIFHFLDFKTLVSLSETCHLFYRLSNDRFLWESLLKSDRKKVIILPPGTDLNQPVAIYKHRKDFDTISEALSHLTENKREIMLLAQGVYQENISIDKPVDIMGEGELGSVVIESSTGNTVSISAPYGSITNVAMRQHGHWFCIDIEKGSFSISKCDITNSTLSAVKIGRSASPWIANNFIHDCKEAGIAIFGGEGTIIGNHFTRNRYGSIEVVYSTSKPTIKLNRIFKNKGYGIHVHTNATAIISENIIEENESDGISCWGGASPVVSNNKIYGKGIYEYNQIFGQKLDGIRISKSNPQISHNTIHHNQGDGVRLVIRANPIITENHICENKRVGIHIYREGMGIVSNNYIYGNKNAGMQVYSRANATICNNKIVQNRCSGIYVSDYAIVNIKGNEITNNGEVGVEIVSGAKALCFEGNNINKNYEGGLAYYMDSKPIGYELTNTFHSNGSAGNQQYIMRQGREIMMYNTKKSNKDLEPISFLVENALQEGMCTLSFTREYYHAQYWYECRTCSEKKYNRSDIAVCEECAKKCHAGHDIGVRKYGHFYCDCGQQLSSPCQCMKPNQNSTSSNLPKPFVHPTHTTHQNINQQHISILS